LVREIASARGLDVHTVEALMRARALTADSIRALPEAAMRRALRRLNYPDLPIAREQFRALHLRSDPTAPRTLRAGGLGRRMRAVQHQDSLRLRTGTPKIAGIPVGALPSPQALSPMSQPGAGGIDPRSWVPLGPANVGGRTRAIVPDPDVAGRIWAGSVGGGVWRSDDDGSTWVPVDDFLANLAVCSLVIAPVKDANGNRTIFAGTGEGFLNGDAIRGAGIFFSSDGVVWTQLASANTPDFQAVNRLAMPSDGKALFAATPTGLMRSDGPAFANWTKAMNVALGDVRCHPSNRLLAVAGGLSNGTAYFTADGGQSWTEARHSGTWGGRVEVTYAAANSATVYASVNSGGGSIWRSTDGGKSYKPMATTAQGQPVSYLGNQGWYANAIWAGDSGNGNAVIVGGIDLWRSNDGGNTLQQISLWSEQGSVHADHHCIVGRSQGAGKPPKVYFGNDGGIFATTDYRTVGGDANHTTGWTRLDGGYGVTQFYGGAGNVGDGTIIAGAQDNGTLRYTPAAGASGWSTMFGGDGGWCAYNPTNNVYFGEYVFCQVTRSVDGGASAEYICGQYWFPAQQKWLWKPPPYLIPDAKSQQALFIAPFVVDPNHGDRILAGGNSLWRTDDAGTPNDDQALTGPSWASIKDSIGQPISAIAVCPGNSEVIWVGHQNGAAFETSDGTKQQPAWRQFGGVGQSLAIGRYCSSIFADANGKDVFISYAAYADGAPGSNVWASADGGSTWTDIGGSLPDAPVHKVTRHPAHPQFLYLGTEIGLFASDDGGMHWSPTNEGPTNCPVYDLLWMSNRLICTTHGRGMFAIDIP
jgi:hypothetical protein